MNDTDVIARIYPYNDQNEQIGKAFKTSSYYVAPLLPNAQPQLTDTHGERESTEPPDFVDVPIHHYLPCVELRLSHIPRCRQGIIFGRGLDSDVILPHYKGIGSYHFSITFDRENRLILKDWGSRIGCEVLYQGEGRGIRRNFCWIVGGAELPLKRKSIYVNIYSVPPIHLDIIVNQQDWASVEYINSVRCFRQGLATAEDQLVNLNIPNHKETEWPSGANTPGKGAIYLTTKIGEGSFSTVTHYWNVSTAAQYALKEPSVKAIRDRRVNIADWQREIRIMSQISHPNIVSLLRWDPGVTPRLYLEYVPCRSLADQTNLSNTECLLVLRQCLAALKYLHGAAVAIVHRDIKPENVLVHSREDDHIQVKLADFGISKDHDDLSTVCGTPRFIAPEIYQIHRSTLSGLRDRKSYGSAVDAWSLGTLVYGLLCAFPMWENNFLFSGIVWAQKILDTFQRDYEERPTELKEFLLEGMILIEPGDRWSALDCHAYSELLPIPISSRYEKPMPASSSN